MLFRGTYLLSFSMLLHSGTALAGISDCTVNPEGGSMSTSCNDHCTWNNSSKMVCTNYDQTGGTPSNEDTWMWGTAGGTTGADFLVFGHRASESWCCMIHDDWGYDDTADTAGPTPGVDRVWLYSQSGNDTLSYAGFDATFTTLAAYYTGVLGDAEPNLVITTQGGDNHIYGSDDAATREELGGGGGDDVIYGLKGNDKITGGLGSDELYGGEGDDIIRGYQTACSTALDGDDLMSGGPGIDRLTGCSGNDLISGGTAVFSGGAVVTWCDTSYSDDGDFIDGNAGTDELRGCAGDDVIQDLGDSDDDVLRGQNGNDTVCNNGSGTNDQLYGGSNNDTLWSGITPGSMDGGTNTDTCFPAGGTSCEVLGSSTMPAACGWTY
ncbi:MAG: hypothetical protein H6733_09240 [Alphaproteobacteria bacterium]|nr:hypothetical protein [Alphaproteobacteria bacterium]